MTARSLNPQDLQKAADAIQILSTLDVEQHRHESLRG